MRTIKSIKHALNGIIHLFKTEHNAQLHLIGVVGIVSINTLLKVNRYDWILTLICIGIIIALEAINTAIEKIANFIQPSYNRHIGLIKDISAGGVLIMGGVSTLIGLLIYTPYAILFLSPFIKL